MCSFRISHFRLSPHHAEPAAVMHSSWEGGFPHVGTCCWALPSLNKQFLLYQQQEHVASLSAMPAQLVLRWRFVCFVSFPSPPLRLPQADQLFSRWRGKSLVAPPLEFFLEIPAAVANDCSAKRDRRTDRRRWTYLNGKGSAHTPICRTILPWSVNKRRRRQLLLHRQQHSLVPIAVSFPSPFPALAVVAGSKKTGFFFISTIVPLCVCCWFWIWNHRPPLHIRIRKGEGEYAREREVLLLLLLLLLLRTEIP